MMTEDESKIEPPTGTVQAGDRFSHRKGPEGAVEEVASVDGDYALFVGGGGWLISSLLGSGDWIREVSALPEAREPEPDIVATEDMMTEAERVEVDALARAVFGSIEQGDRNLLAIRVLEQGAQIERLEREADEGERELQRRRLEASIALARLKKLRDAIAEGATDAAQASAVQTALSTIEEGAESDLGLAGAPMASAFLAALEELKWARGVIVAAGNLFDENAMARAGAR